jgi:hypothetical protein
MKRKINILKKKKFLKKKLSQKNFSLLKRWKWARRIPPHVRGGITLFFFSKSFKVIIKNIRYRILRRIRLFSRSKKLLLFRLNRRIKGRGLISPLFSRIYAGGFHKVYINKIHILRYLSRPKPFPIFKDFSLLRLRTGRSRFRRKYHSRLLNRWGILQGGNNSVLGRDGLYWLLRKRLKRQKKRHWFRRKNRFIKWSRRKKNRSVISTWRLFESLLIINHTPLINKKILPPFRKNLPNLYKIYLRNACVSHLIGPV